MDKECNMMECKYCNKLYKSQGCYNKHKRICQIINTDNKDVSMANADILQVVIELVKSNHKLEKEVYNLKRQINLKTRKVQIIDWLNTTQSPQITLSRFLKEITITRNDLEYIFNNNYSSAFSEILHKIISKCDYLSIFKAYKQKDNTIYVYKDKWEIYTMIEFEELFSILSKAIHAEFQNWEKENESILFSEKFSVQYIKNVKKILGNNSLAKQRTITYRNLYKFLQEDIQFAVNYEFSNS